MRRDYFTLDVTIEEASTTRVTIDFDGPSGSFDERLTDDTGAPLTGNQLDIAYRLLGDSMEPDTAGVLGVTNRITGDFVLECNVDAGRIARFIEAAKKRDSDSTDRQYQFVLRANDRMVLSCDRDLFLVYSQNGELLRQHSLIPSGVEL